MTLDHSETSPRPSCGCPDYVEASRAVLSRRTLLGSAAVVGGAMSLGSALGTSTRAYAVAPASTAARLSPTGNVLVLLSLRGAADGLSLVVPHADPVYYAARPRLAVPHTSLLVPDAMFGLHPALAPLLPLWDAGRLAAVHAAGMPTPNRSHFAAMEAVEDAAPGSTARNGWLNRLLGELPGTSPLQGTAVGNQVPTSLFGAQPAFVVGRVDRAEVAGADADGRRLAALRHAWSGNARMGRAVRDAISGSQAFGAARDLPAQQPAAAPYPATELGRALSDVSRIVRAGVGADVITVDQGDWDMHTDAGTLEWGELKRNAGDLAASVAAFFADLGPLGDRVTLVTLSEFGRRVRENDDYGTDHGFGNVMFVAGGGVRGGYHGRWPGLADTADADVLVTTDYRSVLSEVVTRRFGVSTAQVFPGFAPQPVGVMA